MQKLWRRIRTLLHYQRGLGDVKAPDGSEESVDATQELENIINFYDEYFEKQRKRKKAAIISVIIAMLMIIFVIVCLYLNTIGII